VSKLDLETTTRRGARAEALAWDYLAAQGYRLVARNHRAKGGEVDLIAYDGAVLCFIEVRARSSDELGTPLETIDRPKQLRIIRAARDYLAVLKPPWPEMRFDAVGILLVDPPELELVRGAFEAT
jgi:putative endonuclease